MAVSIAQYVDLLFKKLQGVAKTANATVKSASNESIASPAFLRGDIIWMQAGSIPSTAQTVANITTPYTGGSSVQCTADATVPPIGGIRPTWLTNKTYWVPQEFGPTWLPKVYVGPANVANIEATGTQIFSAGIGGVGEYYFDTQAGVLNFIGETIPSVLTAGNVVYVSGYQYSGALGIGNISTANIGNLNISNTTITTTLANGNITLAATGNSLVQVSGTYGLVIPTGTTAQRLASGNVTGTVRFNTTTSAVEVYTGNSWSQPVSVTNQILNGDGSTTTFALNRETTTAAALIMLNGITQVPGQSYIMSPSPSNNLVFSEPPATSDVIDIRFL